MTKSPAQIFTELTGGCWHEANDCILGVWTCSCGKKFYECEEEQLLEHLQKENNLYSNPADILTKMKEFCGEEKYGEFIKFSLSSWIIPFKEGTRVYINIEYILNPTQLLERACEWLEQNKGE